jgi:hypothetical protein
MFNLNIVYCVGLVRFTTLVVISFKFSNRCAYVIDVRRLYCHSDHVILNYMEGRIKAYAFYIYHFAH